MEVKEINNKEDWESFLSGCEEKTFLDSWNWGEFQKKESKAWKGKIWRFGIYKKKEMVSLFLAVLIRAKRGTFLFVPHGPVLKKETGYEIKKDVLEALLKVLKELAKKEKAAFIRISPIWKRNEENKKVFKEAGFRKAPIHMHPETTWEMTVSLEEEELLKNMRKTTRYLIRQGLKNRDIEIIKSIDVNDLNKFYEIYKKTAERQGFVPFSFDYIKEQFLSFLTDNEIVIFLGKYKEEVVSSAIVVFWQKTAFYHHGASLSKYNNNKIPVSYLVQWEIIKEAKKRGCEKYNFWGVAPFKKKGEKGELNKNHPWYGLSLFKMGFGGYLKEYVRTRDFVLSPMYYFTYFLETIRRIKRRL